MMPLQSLTTAKTVCNNSIITTTNVDSYCISVIMTEFVYGIYVCMYSTYTINVFLLRVTDI